MRLVKGLLVLVPILAIVVVGVIGFRSCMDSERDYVVIQKMHTPPYLAPDLGREVNATWAVVIKRDDGMPPIILQCSREAYDAHNVGDPAEVVTVPIEGGVRVLRLARDAEVGWRPVVHAPKK